MNLFNKPLIYGITGRTDMLGAFATHAFFARFLADYQGCKLAFNENTIINSFQHVWAREFFLSNDEIVKRHISNRIAISNTIITSFEKPDIDIGETGQVQDKILQIGFNEVIKHSQEKVKEDLLKHLPFQNVVDPSKTIAIHFRSGEIINDKDRYLHSSKYSELISGFKQNMPDKEIIIFTAEIPPIDIDDFKSFEGLKIYLPEEVNELETWRIFIEADILVTARSGFSYVPALLRNENQKTYFAKMWHPKLDYWETWYVDEYHNNI
jgi:hypothetical protein